MSSFAKYLMAAAGNTSSVEEGADYREASEYTHIAFDTLTTSGAGDLLGVFIKPDGTKFYHIDVGENVEEYDLSTPFDITSHGSRVSVVNIRTSSYSNGANAAARSIFFKPDGTKMWCADLDDFLYEYTLSTAWDTSTISYTRSRSFTAEFDAFRGLYFSPDGTKMFGIDDVLDRVKRFTLSTAWDMTTETYHSQSSLLDVSTTINEATPTTFWMSDDGLIAYVVGTTRDYIYSWNLTTAWDITQINRDADSSVYIGNQEQAARAICFSPNGRYLYIGGASGHGVDVWDRGA